MITDQQIDLLLEAARSFLYEGIEADRFTDEEAILFEEAINTAEHVLFFFSFSSFPPPPPTPRFTVAIHYSLLHQCKPLHRHLSRRR